MAWILHHVSDDIDIQINKHEFNIGRSNLADFTCPNEHVSREHATFITTPNGDLYVRDNDTVNGTFLNGTLISGKITYELHETDEVGLGVSSGLNIEYRDTSRIVCSGKDIFIVKKLYNTRYRFLDTEDAHISNILELNNDNSMIAEPLLHQHINLTNQNESVDKQLIEEDVKCDIFIEDEDSIFNDVKLESSELNYIDLKVISEKIEQIDVNNKNIDNFLEIKQDPDVHMYTIDDNFIVISDDDDDFPCSQLLDNNISSNNIEENRFNDSMFLQIKNELEELDGVPEGTIFNPITIDDDQENDDWFNEIFNIETNNSNNNNVSNQIEGKTLELKTTDKPETAKKHTTASSKCFKPPIIIEPHFESTTKAKRKPSNKVNETNKKIKVDHNENKEKQIQIRKDRKIKLKEILEKPKHKEDKEVKHTTAPAKIKISEGRGKFLLENCKPCLNNKETASSSCDIHKTKLRLPPTANINTKGSHINQALLQPPVAVRSKNTYVHDAHIHDNKIASTNLIEQSNNYDDIEDILLQILRWNTLWFEEYRTYNELKLPPVNNQPLVEMPKKFSNYSEYYKIIMPQMMVELWNFLYRETINTNMLEYSKKICFAKIVGKRKFRSYTQLQCTTQITKEQNINNNLIKEEDIIIIQYKFKTTDLEPCNTSVVLGYISDVRKQYLHSAHTLNENNSNVVNKPEAKVYFKVFIKDSKGEPLIDKLMKYKVLTSIVSTMRIFKAIKHLEFSPLSQHILNPKIDLYRFHDDVPNRKLFSKDNLNDIQYKVVNEAAYLCTRKEPGVYLIQGPPGTGKTTVILNIIQQILFENNGNNENNILVVAPSNGAIDEVVSRIITLRKHLEDKFRKHVKLIRLGPKCAIHPDVSSYSLYEIAKRNLINDVINSSDFKKSVYYKEIITINEKIMNIKIHNKTYKTDHSYISAKLELETACRKVMGKKFNFALKKSELTCLEGARIICTTLSSCMGVRMEEVFGRSSKKITCCIVDEATQSNEAQNLIPLSLGISKIVLVGDPKQLPAVIQAKEVKELGYGQSLFSRIMLNFMDKEYNPVNMLKIQYRMHPSISYYPNKEFYNGHLLDFRRNGKSLSHTLSPYLVFNFEMNINTAQYINTLEIDCVLKLLDAIMLKIGKTSCIYSVGVITPYNNQKEGIINKLKEKIYMPNISICVNTVDSFQGQEKDIIIMSCVRSSSNNFLKDEQRLNVALTRAKHVLYIIGCSKLFKNCEVIGKIANDAKERQLLRKLNIHMDSLKLTELISK